MCLDELIINIKSISSISLVLDLEIWFENWKKNDMDFLWLEKMVEKYFKLNWVDNNIFEKLYQVWTDYKNDSIKYIGGMTMFERLFVFSLLDEFEYGDEQRKKCIYKKVLAKKER